MSKIHSQASYQSIGLKMFSYLNPLPKIAPIAQIVTCLFKDCFRKKANPRIQKDSKDSKASQNILTQVIVQGEISIKSSRKMHTNLIKSILEHQREAPSSQVTLIRLEQLYLTNLSCGCVNFSTSEAHAVSFRPTMEDAHFIKKINENLLLGVFDGHRGDTEGAPRGAFTGHVAKAAADLIQELFYATLIQANGDIRTAFFELFKTVQAQILSNHLSVANMGSTAVVSYVSHADSKIYTATIGDSEAKLYRKIDGMWKSIPLSNVRHWKSAKDRQRFTEISFSKEALKKELCPQELYAIQERFFNEKSSKEIYFFGGGQTKRGLNVSRAFGNNDLCFYFGKAGVIQKPKVTEINFQKGDRVIVACDGVWDYLSEQEVITIISTVASSQLSEAIKDYTLSKHKAHDCDNITVIGLEID